MQPDNNNCNNQGHQHIQPNIGENQCDHSDKSQRTEHDPVVQGLTKKDERGVSIEIEEEPGNKDDDEDNHRDGVPEEAEEEDEESGHGVVDPEVVEIPSDARERVRVGQRERERGEWGEKLGPGPPRGYEGLGCARGTRHEGQGSRGGGWRLRGGGGGGGGGAVTGGGFQRHCLRYVKKKRELR